jgi:hypothetical protein
MPRVTFTDAQINILNGSIGEYQKIEKTNFIASFAKQVASPEELRDGKAWRILKL